MAHLHEHLQSNIQRIQLTTEILAYAGTSIYS